MRRSCSSPPSCLAGPPRAPASPPTPSWTSPRPSCRTAARRAAGGQHGRAAQRRRLPRRRLRLGRASPAAPTARTSHWQRFIDAYVAEIRSRDDCGDLTDPAGPCAKVDRPHARRRRARHGRRAVGLAVRARDGRPRRVRRRTRCSARTRPGFAELSSTTPFNLINTSEYVMDIIALVEGGRLAKAGTFVPPTDDLLAAYAAIKRDRHHPRGHLRRPRPDHRRAARRAHRPGRGVRPGEADDAVVLVAHAHRARRRLLQRPRDRRLLRRASGTRC